MYKLVQLVGKRGSKNGTKTIKQPVDQIMVENEAKDCGLERLGFISRHSGAHINFKPGLSDGQKQEAFAAVKAIRDQYGMETSGNYVAAAELPEELILAATATGEEDDE